MIHIIKDIVAHGYKTRMIELFWAV